MLLKDWRHTFFGVWSKLAAGIDCSTVNNDDAALIINFPQSKQQQQTRAKLVVTAANRCQQLGGANMLPKLRGAALLLCLAKKCKHAKMQVAKAAKKQCRATTSMKDSIVQNVAQGFLQNPQQLALFVSSFTKGCSKGLPLLSQMFAPLLSSSFLS